MATKSGKRKTTRQAGGMFAEFEPAPPKPAAETVPMFELPAAAAVTVPRDYGQAVAPVREAVPSPMFGVVLAVDETTGALAIEQDMTD